MIYPVLLLVLIIVVASILLHGRAGGETAALKRRFRQLMSLSGQEADHALKRQLKAVRKKYPGRSEQWYLEKIVYDLERDRR